MQCCIHDVSSHLEKCNTSELMSFNICIQYFMHRTLPSVKMPHFLWFSTARKIQINRCQSANLPNKASMTQKSWCTLFALIIPKQTGHFSCCDMIKIQLTCVSWQFSSVKCFCGCVCVCVRVAVDQSCARCSRTLSFSSGDETQSTWVKTTFGYFSCHRRQTKAHFGPSKGFLSSRSADARPNMGIGSAAILHSPRLLSEILHLVADRTRNTHMHTQKGWG